MFLPRFSRLQPRLGFPVEADVPLPVGGCRFPAPVEAVAPAPVEADVFPAPVEAVAPAAVEADVPAATGTVEEPLDVDQAPGEPATTGSRKRAGRDATVGVPFVGLTGGIGAGKSVALAALADLGAAVIDGDAIVHRLYATEEVRGAVRARLQRGVRGRGGRPHRARAPGIRRRHRSGVARGAVAACRRAGAGLPGRGGLARAAAGRGRRRGAAALRGRRRVSLRRDDRRRRRRRAPGGARRRA